MPCAAISPSCGSRADRRCARCWSSPRAGSGGVARLARLDHRRRRGDSARHAARSRLASDYRRGRDLRLALREQLVAGDPRKPGARRDFFRFVQTFALQCGALIAASWIGGAVLGALVRRAIATNAALFLIVLLGGYDFMHWLLRAVTPAFVPGIPLARTWFFRASDNPLSVEVFSSTFFGLVFPLLVPAALVMLPLIVGMRRASVSIAAPTLVVAALLGGSTIVTTAASPKRAARLSAMARPES